MFLCTYQSSTNDSCGQGTLIQNTLQLQMSYELCSSQEPFVLEDFNIHAMISLSGAFGDLKSSMKIMGLFLGISHLTHVAGCTLDLVFCVGQEKVTWTWKSFLVLFPWTSHNLMEFKLTGTHRHCQGGEFINIVPLGRLMDPNYFSFSSYLHSQISVWQ